ncbi:hypothetical protein P12x_005767 [Tundrisphaera lichenicola]|uniref:hypothetical protein n=1 Tax=Tundrisphaera lichenicola TaxID=2029860 RepID=UPI003EBCEAE4
MTCNYRWIGAVAVGLALTGTPARAQFYGGGYWGGGYGGGQTPQGDMARGAGVYAMGAGQYNLDTSQARSINADTAMRWNQYIYDSRVQSAKVWHAKMARDEKRSQADFNAIRTRLRDNPTTVDISRGDALNVVLDEMMDPRGFSKSVYYGHKVKLGGDMIRNIPFSYASAAISTSVHQLMDGGPPPSLKTPEFAKDRVEIKAVADELRKQGADGGKHDPATIDKLQAMLVDLQKKVETVYPRNSSQRNEATKYLKAAHGLASMLETPAVNVLLAGVENRPEATLGDLLGFMAAYNLRFGAATTPAQRQIYTTLYPMLTKLRDDSADPNATATAAATPVDANAPADAFEGVGYNNDEKAPMPPPPPTPAPAPK